MTEHRRDLARKIARIVAAEDEATALWVVGYLVGVTGFRLGHDRVASFVMDFQRQLMDAVEEAKSGGEILTIH